MVVTSSADRPQIYSERVRNLSGLNHTKLEQDGGNSVRLIQDLLQACVMQASKIDDLKLPCITHGSQCFCVGAKMECVGGPHSGKVGVVTKVCQKMVFCTTDNDVVHRVTKTCAIFGRLMNIEKGLRHVFELVSAFYSFVGNCLVVKHLIKKPVVGEIKLKVD